MIKLDPKIKHIYVAIDISGSMIEWALRLHTCLENIIQLANEMGQRFINVIKFDSEIYDVFNLEHHMEIDLDKCWMYGGTSYVPVIKYMNGEGPYKFNMLHHNPEKSVLFIFTDGFGDHEIPKPKCQLYWVMPNRTSVFQLKMCTALS